MTLPLDDLDEPVPSAAELDLAADLDKTVYLWFLEEQRQKDWEKERDEEEWKNLRRYLDQDVLPFRLAEDGVTALSEDPLVLLSSGDERWDE